LHDTTWSDSHYDLGLAWLVVSCRKAFDEAQEGVEGESVHPSVAKAAHALRHEGANWNLEQLARHSGASASWLCRLFQQQMGVSLTVFRNRQRFESSASCMAVATSERFRKLPLRRASDRMRSFIA
jgi:transcriptional regulator GlxA family with amidase domain